MRCIWEVERCIKNAKNDIPVILEELKFLIQMFVVHGVDC